MKCRALDYAKMFNNFNYYYFISLIVLFLLAFIYYNLAAISDPSYGRVYIVKKIFNNFFIGSIIILLIMLFISGKLVDLTDYLCSSSLAYLPVVLLSIPLINFVFNMFQYLHNYIRYGRLLMPGDYI